MSGWISLDRAITKHWLWQNEKFTKGQAWIDLLLHAAHSDHKTLIKGVLIHVARSEQIRSQVTLANTWNWDRKTVSRFLKLLEKDGMIVSRVDHLTSYVSICNYDSFQNNTGDDTQHKGHLKGQQAPSREDTNNKGNKENNDNNKDSVSRFEKFWDLYGKKDSRAKCEPKFNKLKESEIDLIFKNLPAYIKSTPDVKFRKNPFTWLNGKCWDNEIAEKKDYSFVVTDFNKSFYNCDKVPTAEMMTSKRIDAIEHLFATTTLKPETVANYFDHVSTSKAFAWERGETGNDAVDLSYFLTEQAYNKARER